MDLVDEQNVAALHLREPVHQVAGLVDRRAAGDANRRPQLAGNDLGKRRLAQAWRAGQQHVLQRLLTLGRRLQGDAKLLDDFPLTDDFIKALGAKRFVESLLVRAHRTAADDAFADHARSTLAASHAVSQVNPLIRGVLARVKLCGPGQPSLSVGSPFAESGHHLHGVALLR